MSRESRIYKITATKEQLNILEIMFNTMEKMGKVGASRTFKLYVDGDGAFHPKIKRISSNLLEEKDLSLDIDDKQDSLVIGDGFVKKNPDDEKYPDNRYWKFYDFG